MSKNKTKIIIITSILNKKSGAKAPIELALSLAKKYQVTIIANSQKSDLLTVKELVKNKVKIITYQNTYKNEIRTFFDKLNFYYKNVLSLNPHLISFHGFSTELIACFLTTKPIILTYYGTQWNILQEKYIYPNFVLVFLDKMINIFIFVKTFISIWIATEVIPISIATKNELKKKYFKESTHIYLGIKPQKLLKKIINAKKIRLISVSRFTPYKGFHKIISFLSQSKINYRLYIIGTQESVKYTKYLKAHQNKKIKLLENISEQKLNLLYSNSDIYITFDKYLFFGLPILEAANHKLPSIVANYQAAKEVVIDTKTGYIINNKFEFLQKLEMLAKSPKLRQALGKQASVFAKTFNWKKTAKQYESIFTKYVQN